MSKQISILIKFLLSNADIYALLEAIQTYSKSGSLQTLFFQL